MKTAILPLICALGLSANLRNDAQTGGIYYIRTPDPNQFQLARINPDGQSDQPVNLGLITPTFPCWSSDGALLALTAVNPLRPGKISQDVFTYEPASGRVQLLVPFQDVVGTVPVTTNGVVIGQQNRFTYTVPLYKAFSPDRTRIAVASLVTSGFYQTQQSTNLSSLSGTTQTPLLQLYSAVDGLPQEIIILGRVRTFYTLGGYGVDWHPTQNMVVAPIDVDAPTVGSTSPSESSALFLIEAVPNAVALGRGRQLTHPQGVLETTLFNFTATIRSDYAPAFSPDGRTIAYLRADNIIDSFGGVTQHRPIVVTIRAIDFDGANDRVVLPLAPGVFCTKVSWSPDGMQLVFDTGHQPTPQPLELARLEAEPGTLQLSVVDATGANPHLVRGVPAGMPGWQPGLPGITGTRLGISVLRTDTTNLVIRWPTVAQPVTLESTSTLAPGNWSAVTAAITTNAGESSVTIPATAGPLYFRLRMP